MKLKTRYMHPIGPEFSKIDQDKDIKLLAIRTQPFILGLTGATKVGKTQIAKYLVTEYNFVYVSMATPLNIIARNIGKKSPTWQELAEIAFKLRMKNGDDYLAKQALTLIDEQYNGSKRVVIDGVIHPAEVDLLKRREKFYLLGIIAKDSLRTYEAGEWGSIPKEDIQARDSYEQVYGGNQVHQPNILTCLNASDQRIEIEDFNRMNLFEKTKLTIESILSEVY